MKKQAYQFLQRIIVVVVLAVMPFFALAQIDITVNMSPPYPTKLADYLSRGQQFQIIIHNGATTVKNVQLRGQFTSDNGVSIIANPNYKSPAPITLNPNETRHLTIDDISNLFDINKVTLVGITRQQLVVLNGVPEGNYQICLQAYDYYTNQSLSAGQPSGCSNIIPISDVEPPTIVSPYDGQVVATSAGQNFIISWSTPAGSPPSTQYNVRIAEIYGNLTPANALNSTQVPIFFQQTVTAVNSLLYGPAMPAMVPGRHYAMSVTAVDPFNSVTYRNNGQSVVTSFVYGDAPVAADTIAAVVAPPLPLLSVKGRLQWYFRATDEGVYNSKIPYTGNVDYTPGTTVHNDAMRKISVSIIPNYAPVQSRQQLYVNNPGLPAAINQALATAARAPYLALVYTGSTLYTTTDAIGNFNVSFGDVLDRLSLNNQSIMNLLGYGAVQSFTVTVQFADGNNNLQFTQSYNGVSCGAATLSTGQVTGGYDMGTVKEIANTYRYIPKIVDGTGKELTDGLATVYCRATEFKAATELHYSGNSNLALNPTPPVEIDGILYNKIATIADGNTETRMFYPTSPDEYKVVVNEGDFSTYTTSLVLAQSKFVSPFTYTATYNLANAPTTFSGHIFKTANNIQQNAVGAMVQLINGTNLFYAVTDSAGNFNIQNGINIGGPGTQAFPKTLLPVGAQQFTVQYNGQAISDVVQITHIGQNATKNEVMTEVAYPVSGTITDVANNPLPNANIRWASGGASFAAAANGKFTTSNAAGTDTLIITKLGYAEQHVIVVITTTGAVEYKSITIVPTITVSRTGVIGITDIPSATIVKTVNGNLGNIILQKSIGKFDVVIVNGQNQPVPGATLVVEGVTLPQSAVSNSNGVIAIDGPSGDLVLDVIGPATGNYAPAQVAWHVAADGSVTTIPITLLTGVKLTGKVTANSIAVAGATVGIPGFDYSAVTTAADGSYAIVLPKGATTVKAAMQGYVGDTEREDLTADKVVNFALTNPGFNISKLLGFDVQIDAIKDNGNTKLISGSIINIKANPLFSATAGTKLKFNDVEVTLQSDNTLAPVSSQVAIYETSVDVKAFGYLPLTLSNYGNPLMLVKANGSNAHGQIQGNILGINFASFMPLGMAAYSQRAVNVTNTTAGAPVTILTDDGTTPGSMVLKFANSGNLNFNVYGFDIIVDVANSFISANTDAKPGIHLVGTASFANIPVIANTKISFQDLWIGTNGYVAGTTIQTTGLKLNLAGWGTAVNQIAFTDNGFKLSGQITVQLPTSGSSIINFSNLQISSTELFGGSFTLPSTGINVFNIASLVTSKPLEFGKTGTAGVYCLSGGGNIDFSGVAATYINNITINSFQVQTDGGLAINASPDLNQSFFGGLAKINISNLGISTLNGTKQLDVTGNFLLAIPGFSGQVGGIHIRNGSVSVDNLGLGFDVAGIGSASVNVAFSNQPGKAGFAGAGSFDVADFLKINANFHYYKLTGGVDIATSFETSTAIALGSSGLLVTQLGGGFKVNTAKRSWGVLINGFVSVGEGTFTGMKVGLEIDNGPVITGTDTVFITGIKLGQGRLLIDIPHSLFEVNFSEGIQLPGISANGGGLLALSLSPSEKYFFLGIYADANALGIIKIKGGACVAFNFNYNNHRTDPLFIPFAAAFDNKFLQSQGGMFNGITAYASASSSLDNILPNFDIHAGFDFSIHSHFDMGAQGYVYMGVLNGRTPTLHIDFSVYWNAGASASIGFLGADVSAGVSIGFTAGLSGTATANPYRVAMEATGGFYLHIFVGDIDPSYCKTGIVLWNWPDHDWASLCIQANMTIGYDTNNSFPYFYAHL